MRGSLSRVLTFAAVAVVAVGGCKPKLEGRASLVDTDRVIAVRSVPAELTPDGKATAAYEALYAGPDGAPDPGALEWAFCTEPKPLAVSGPIALQCLRPSGNALTEIGMGGSTSAPVPKDVCSIFGPSPPQPEPGKPAARPADPDTTGGYYQPVRVMVPTASEPDYAVGVTRIDCGLANAPQDAVLAYAKTYRPNENPAFESLSLVHASGKAEDVPSDPSAPALTVERGETVTFRAKWPDCPLEPSCGDGLCTAGENATSCADDCKADLPPKGCAGSEPYTELDPLVRRLVDRRESMRVAWFATEGEFDHDRTGRTEAEAALRDTENAWTAPDGAGTVFFWAVIRDDRGGVGWTPFHVDVQ
jgi:hypothetical protein